RAEGNRFVVRDLASTGPRASAPSKFVTAAILAVVAAGLWIDGGLAMRDSGASGRALGALALAALGALTADGFYGVARLAVKYGARSSACVVIGNDRVVAAPWVSRGGAIDERPEGRFGAAIPLHEVRGVGVVPRDGAFAVELDTDHGAIDALVSE